YICGRDHGAFRVEGKQLPSEDHVAIDRLVSGSRLSLLSRPSPELCGPAHRRCRQREVFQKITKSIEPLDSLEPSSSEQLSANFVVSDLGHQNPRLIDDEAL